MIGRQCLLGSAGALGVERETRNSPLIAGLFKCKKSLGVIPSDKKIPMILFDHY